MALIERNQQFAQPPRKVPLALYLDAIFGDWFSLGPELLAIVLSLFVAIFSLDSEAITALEWRGASQKALGEVTSVEQTWSSENKRDIYRVNFRYNISGKPYTSSSFGANANRQYSTGKSVTIEYLVNNPKVATVMGMRRRTFSSSAFIPIVFWLVCYGVAAVGWVRGGARCRILKNGVLVWARLIDKQRPLGNKKTSVLLTYEYVIPDTQTAFRADRKVTATIEESEPQKITDDEEEPALCEPNNPQQLFFIDKLPEGTTVDEQGQLRASLGSVSGVLGLTAVSFGILVAVVLYIVLTVV